MKMVFQLRQSAILQSRSPDSATNFDFIFIFYFHEFWWQSGFLGKKKPDKTRTESLVPFKIWIDSFFNFFSFLLILISLFIEVRICEGVEIEDYYDDEESVDCVLVKDSAPTFEYFYNTESNCPQNTKCVNGRQCGVKGTSTKGVFFFRKCNVFFKSQRKFFSKKLSWTWNLNFPPITVTNKFKFQAEDSFFEIFFFKDWEFWKTNPTFWRKATFKY